MISFRKLVLAAAVSVVAVPHVVAGDARAQTLRVAMHSDVKILDPIWTVAYIQRNHGYMVWDTPFAMDEKLDVKPQMVESYSLSPDNLVWSFTLRDGLEWHDGKPVTADDCIASIKRWAVRDTMGQRMMASVQGFETVDSKTFKMTMKEPYGLVLQSLGKPSSNVPFMMPKRVAETDAMQQIKLQDVIGSGPFILKGDEWKPGEKTVYVKNTKYKPRSEPPSGLAGGKVVKVDRVEWLWLPDALIQVTALQGGEIDMLEQPSHDLLPLLAADKNINLFRFNSTGSQYAFRFNNTAKPFDNPRIRHAVFVAFEQESFLKAAVGNPDWYKVCKAPFICDTALATDARMADVLNGNAAKARPILAEEKYDGTSVVLLAPTDLPGFAALAPVAKAQLERAGFEVDMQSMDWQTLVNRRTKKNPPAEGGWHAFANSWAAVDILNPVVAGFFNASCDKAMFGWPCDSKIEAFRDRFARESDPTEQKLIVEELQRYWVDHPTHINLGQWFFPIARRNNVEGNLVAPLAVFWNITKK